MIDGLNVGEEDIVTEGDAVIVGMEDVTLLRTLVGDEESTGCIVGDKVGIDVFVGASDGSTDGDVVGLDEIVGAPVVVGVDDTIVDEDGN